MLHVRIYKLIHHITLYVVYQHTVVQCTFIVVYVIPFAVYKCLFCRHCDFVDAVRLTDLYSCFDVLLTSNIVFSLYRHRQQQQQHISCIEEFLSTLLAPRAEAYTADSSVPPPHYVYDMYSRAIDTLCHLVITHMTLYQKQVMTSTVIRNSSSTFPLSVVHSLYKLSEYFSPAAFTSDSFYDEALKCTVCKIYPIYKPCTRTSKKKIIDSFSRQCLQCFITTGISSRADTVYKYVAEWLVRQHQLVDCKCHKYTLLLFFPAFIMFASQSSVKLLLREQLMDIISVHHPSDTCPPSYPINTLAISHIRTEGDRRRKNVDKTYLKRMIANSLVDHFMLCTGPCVYMCMTLRLSGASSRTSQFLSLLTSLIGSSDTVYPPPPQHEDSAVTRRDEGELYIERLKFYIHQIKKTNHHGSSISSPQHHPRYYCPSCTCHIDTLLTTLPRVSKLDNLTEISRRLGAYSVSHYDSFAPGGGGAATKRR